MRPLATTQLMMTWLSMCSTNESTAPREKMAHIAYTSAILVSSVIGFVVSLAYCLTFFSTDFDGAAFAFMVVVEEFGVFYFMIAAILMRRRIDGIFTSLSTIYKSHKNEESYQYLARANETSEWMWGILFKYIKYSLPGLPATSLLSVLYCYLVEGDFNIDHYYRPAKYLLPWNQSTYLGYFAEMCVAILVAYECMILNGTPLLLFITLCMHHQAFYKMLKNWIITSKKCDAKLLCDLIRFHISAKNCFLDSAIVYRSFVLVQLICNAVLMTVSVFYIDLQWQQFDFIMATILITTSVGMANLFLYCYFGKLATDSYAEMPDRLFEMNWYEQPNKLQKHFILMIQNMQKPLYYHGFKVAKLDLETFVWLFRKVFSLYIAIKTLASK